VEVLDALAAENGRVFRTVEVFDALVVLLAQVRCDLCCKVWVLRFVQVGLQAPVEVDVRQEGVLGNDFVEDVEVEGEFVHRFDSLKELPADGTADAPFTEKVAQAGSAEGVTAPHNYPWNPVTDIVFIPAEVAEIQLPVFVICIE
jgi:hypothetical protein